LEGRAAGAGQGQSQAMADRAGREAQANGARDEKLCGGAIGCHGECIFLRTKEINLAIVRRWGTIGEYFFCLFP